MQLVEAIDPIVLIARPIPTGCSGTLTSAGRLILYAEICARKLGMHDTSCANFSCICLLIFASGPYPAPFGAPFRFLL
jgi:hypothetical protein